MTDLLRDRTLGELRSHMPTRSRVLNDLCDVARTATACDLAVITIHDRKQHYVIGGSNMPLDAFPLIDPAGVNPATFAERTRLDEKPLMRDHPLVSGEILSVRSTLSTPVHFAGMALGLIGLASERPEGAFSALDRALLFRLARVAEGLLQSEVALSRMATEALAVITGGLR